MWARRPCVCVLVLQGEGVFVFIEIPMGKQLSKGSGASDKHIHAELEVACGWT